MNCIYKIGLLAVLVMFGFGCKDDFFDKDPIAESSEVSYYTSYEALNNTTTAAYGILCSLYTFDVYYSIGLQAMCDDVEVGGENTNDWPAFQNIDKLIHAANDGEMFGEWAYLYKGIRMCNTVLKFADAAIAGEQAANTSASESNIELINQRIAEVHFLRAWYHFVLMQVYGGVPIVDELVSESTLERATVAEVLHFIEDELIQAIPVLKERSDNEADSENYGIGRASKGAAKALLAKAYLYESSYAENFSGDERFGECTNQYSKALIYAEEVISSAEYYLEGYAGERYDRTAAEGEEIGGFKWLFTLEGDNSREEVWSIQNVQDAAGWVYTRGSYYTTYVTVRWAFDDSGNSKATGGWSFNLPSAYLLEAFGNNDSREIGLNSEPMDATLDPRFKATIGVPGDSIYCNIDGQLGWREMDFKNLPTETISRKYECSDAGWLNRGSNTDGESPLNNKLIRYADVVLIAAEAAFKTADQAKALKYVNMVRTRARMSGDTGYPVDLTAISFMDIVHERRLEFAMENSRVFDLVRWGLGSTFIDGIELSTSTTKLDFVEGKHEFFPIPEEEIERAVSGLENYDAWQ